MHPRSLVQDASRLLLAAAVCTACTGSYPPLRPMARATAPAPEIAPAAWEDRDPIPVIPATWETYLVQPGDTLQRIAACRGTSVSALADANGLVDPHRLAVGAPLRVPPGNLCASEMVASARPAAGRAARATRASAAGARSAGAPSSAARSPARTAPAEAAATPAPAQEAARERARSAIATARARYDAADFEAALAASGEAQRALDPVPRDAASDALRARSHLLAAMAQVGLEHRDRALAELRKAFALDPDLELPPEDASPRIVELVVEARPARTAGEAEP